MKRNRIVAISLSIIVFVMCVSVHFEGIAVNSAQVNTSQVLSETAVLVPESQLTCDFIPQNNPTRAVLKNYTGEETRIILPETVNGYPLVNLSGNCFTNNTDLEYIKLSSNIVSINSKHFGKGCSVQYIDVDSRNPNITSVDGVVYNKEKTALLAFPNGRGGSFTIPDGVTSVNQDAFYHCTFITEIIMPDSVEAVYKEAFMHCFGLENVRMSVNLTSIGDYAFSYCDSLRSIDLPYSLLHIGTDAFLGYFSSDNHRVYFLTDGISYVPGTYSEEYVSMMHLPNEVKRYADRKITDDETGVTVIDPAKSLPNTGKLELTVNVLPAEDYKDMLPGTFTEIFCYEISLTNDGAPIPLTENLILRFDGLGDNLILSSARVFRIEGDQLYEYTRTPHAPFVGASAKKLGVYVVGISNDFSMKGDINGDKVVSTYDSMFALYIAADLIDNISDPQFKAADYNNDGKVTTDDALLILRKAADLI